jgi:outer membrane protein assembly factor BamA
MAGLRPTPTIARMTVRSIRSCPAGWWLVLGLVLPVPAAAQNTPDPGRELSDNLTTVSDYTEPRGAEDDEEEKKKRDLIIVPIPQSSPSLGSGITLVGAMFYNPNNSPEPWISGIGVMRTSNGSKAIAAMHKMALSDDKFRLIAFAGYADVNIDFFGIGPSAGDRGRSIELNEKGLAVIVQGQMRVWNNVYFGPRLIYVDLSTSINREEPLFPDAELPRAEFDTTLAELGAVLSYDTRDSSLEPKNGEFATAAWMHGVEALGSDFQHDKVTIAGNIYRPLGSSTVLAARASYCGVSTGGPFYDLCLYGMNSDLRGYETGRYRDRGYWATQVELRRKLFGRFGAAVFAGVGESMPDPTGFGDGKLLPAGGFGLRYRPSRQTPVNLRLDFAWGKHSNAIYLSLGEAF